MIYIPGCKVRQLNQGIGGGFSLAKVYGVCGTMVGQALWWSSCEWLFRKKVIFGIQTWQEKSPIFQKEVQLEWITY